MSNNKQTRQATTAQGPPRFQQPHGEQASSSEESTSTKTGFFNKFFNRNRPNPTSKRPQINLKGQRVHYGSNPEVSMGAIEQTLYKIDRGPKMLPRKLRFKVWGGLIFIGGWFTFCYTLIAYRLKSDDLELMEREVYEELAMKKQIDILQREIEKTQP